MSDLSPAPLANIEKKHVLSSIWFLPFIAALLGGWILFQHLTHANTEIEIHFENAESIIVDKTKVRYKGVIIGTVKRIELDEQSGVNIIAEIESHAAFMLREQTKFWLVSPKASLTSVSGLDTLFSGSYINLQPGEGEKTDVFSALTDQPISIPENALLVNIESEAADSINVGTPIFYKKIKVGEIAQIKLSDGNQHINIKAFIENKYSHLIKDNSKFWNISGLQANLSRTGVDLKLDSISSLIAGGITFSSPLNSPAISKHKTFKLFASIDETKTGKPIELVLDNITNLPIGAGILFNGHGIGKLTAINYSKEENKFIAKALINSQFSPMMVDGAQFWLEKTAISFSKIENIGNIISGDYIAFLPTENSENIASPKTRFEVSNSPKSKTEILKLTLLTKDASGLNKDDPITYQGLQIGNIDQLNFADNGQFVEISININHPYQYLVTSTSQFYLLSGINIDASLNKLSIQSSPLENILGGGIGLYNAQPIPKSGVNKSHALKQQFHLYPSKEMAKLGKNVFSKPLEVSLLSRELPSISEGAPVYYHKFPIGEVSSFSIDNSALIRTDLTIKAEYKHLIKETSIFWNVSGFNVEAGLSGIKINANSLASVAMGGIAVELGKANVNNKFSNGLFKLFDNFEQATQQPQVISILFDQSYDLQVGSKLKLKGITIGKVTALVLNNKNLVEVTAEISPQYSQQVTHSTSQFWVESPEVSLSGVKNISTLVSGVYINVLPGKGVFASRFIGEGKSPMIAPEKVGLPIILLANNAGSNDIGSPVYHRQIQIGEVANKQLSKNASGVEITLNIYPKFAHLIRVNSIFWPSSGFNLEVGITGASLKSNSLASLVKGGISMSTDDSVSLQPASGRYKRFRLQDEFQEKWHRWKLTIPTP